MDSVAYTPPRMARSNGLDLCYDTFGSESDPPILLIMGLGQQMIGWDDALCRQLAARGFYVVRFDNRDVGKSTHLTGGGRFTAWEIFKFRVFKRPVAAPYEIHDLALDAVGLLDALHLESAHLVGVSMGGMVAQEVTLSFPDRVRSLTSIMSTTGDPRLPGPTREAMALLLTRPAKTKAEFVRSFGAMWRVLRVGSFPEDEAGDDARAERIWERGVDPAGTGRQLRAIFASGSRRARLAKVKVPTLVIHGTVDPLIPPPAGQATADAVPGSKLLWMEGMGHAMPTSMWTRLLDAIEQHARNIAEPKG